MMEMSADAENPIETPKPELSKRPPLKCVSCHSLKWTRTVGATDFDMKGFYTTVTMTCENGHTKTEKVYGSAQGVPVDPRDKW